MLRNYYSDIIKLILLVFCLGCGLPELDERYLEINLLNQLLNQNSGRSSQSLSSIEEIGLQYPNTEYFFERNQPIDPIFPTHSVISQYSFSSNITLPSGLNLNSDTGEISGTPDTTSSPIGYIITATDSQGSSSFTINITVSDCNPNSSIIHFGTGIAADPFLICNPEQLQDMGIHHISHSGAHYRLEKSLDLSSISNFLSIGDDTNTFIGIFDGQNFSIDNLNINNPGINYQGLFGYVEGGLASKIMNIRIVNSNVNGGNDTGVVVGYGYVVLDRVVVENATLVGGSYLGGLTGRSGFGGNLARIYDSSFAGTISCAGNCGGIAGYGRDSEIHRSFSQSTINSTGARVAGIVGWNVSISVADSYWMGSVVGTGSVGGIMGRAVTTSPITNSFANGSVSVVVDSGGLVGASSTNVIDSFYNSDITSHSDSGADRGEPRTSAQMQCPTSPGETCSGQTTYTNWDPAIWNFGTSSEYPCLISVSPGCN